MVDVGCLYNCNLVPSPNFHSDFGREIGPGNIGGVQAVDIHDITIHVTLDQFGSNIATQFLNRATDKALDHVQL